MNTPSALLASAALTLLAPASRPAACPDCTLVSYTLTVSPADSTRLAVEMRVQNPPRSMRVAFAADATHPTRYAEAVRDLAADGATVTRESPTVWRVATNGDDVRLRYHVAVASTAATGQSTDASTVGARGAVVRPRATFLYMVDRPAQAYAVRVVAPEGWRISTALFHSADGPSLYTAPTFERLIDATISLDAAPRVSSSATLGTPHTRPVD